MTGPAIVSAQGDLLYATAANALARLAKGTSGQIVRQNNGLTAPAWAGIEISANYDANTRNATGNAGAWGDITGLSFTFAVAYTVNIIVIVSFRKSKTGADGPGTSRLMIDGTALQPDGTVDSSHVCLIGVKTGITPATITYKLQFSGANVAHASDFINTSFFAIALP